VPLLADGCVIDIIEEDGSRRQVASAGTDPAQEALIADLVRRSPLRNGQHPVAEAARTGQSRQMPGSSDETEADAVQNAGYLRVAEALNLQSGIVLPMVAHEHIVGVITLLFTTGSDRYEAYDLIAAQDLAQRAALAVDNARLYQVARQAILARDNLLAMASHDLRTPLGVIKGYAHLLERRINRLEIPRKETWSDAFARIDAAVQRMVYQLDELMDISHLQAGKSLTLNYEQTDLIKLVERTAEEQQALTSRHRIFVESELRELIGWYDVVRVERVLINLVTNAIKYSPKGGDIRISVTSETDESGCRATIRVQDQGIGIPADDLPHIFQRFYRASNVDDIKGTGIGLATVEWIVTQHGGKVALDSVQGQGTSVVVDLPCTR
jgi:signal transduction histidine kinase